MDYIDFTVNVHESATVLDCRVCDKQIAKEQNGIALADLITTADLHAEDEH